MSRPLNSVPFVAQGSDIVHTGGARDGEWTIEAVDWTTGESRFHYRLGGSRFNSLGAGITVDDDGRLLLGNIFGKTRILRAGRRPSPSPGIVVSPSVG